MPDRMPNRMSEDMSDRMPEDLPARKCINVMVGITRSKVIFFCIINCKYIYIIYIHTEMGLRPSGFRFGPILGKPVLRISHAKRMLP